MPGLFYKTGWRERYPPSKWKKYLLPHLLCSNPPQLQRPQSWLHFIAHYKNKIANKYVLKVWQLAIFCCFSSSLSWRFHFLFFPTSNYLFAYTNLNICYMNPNMFSFHFHLSSSTSYFTQSFLQYRKFAIVFAASEQFLPFLAHTNILSTLTPN